MTQAQQDMIKQACGSTAFAKSFVAALAAFMGVVRTVILFEEQVHASTQVFVQNSLPFTL